MNGKPENYKGRSGRGSIERETAKASAGMVVSAHPAATEIGAEILKKGGNAVDAAAAVQFALNIVEPMMSGIGGSGFMMVYEKKSGDIKIFDGHVRAPKAAAPDLFLNEEKEVIPFRERSTKGNAVGVPGILKAIDAALSEYGTMSLAEVIEPSIKLAEEGYPVNWVFCDSVKNFNYRFSDAAKEYYAPEGKELQEGDILKKKELAEAYRILQKEGVSAFYGGRIGKKIIESLKEHGGIMELTDLEDYSITVDEPLKTVYRGYDVYSVNAPSAGGFAVQQILRILEGFDLKKYGPRSWERYYLTAEAMRLAFTDKKAFFCDPEYGKIPIKGMTDDAYIAERRALINFKERNNRIEHGNPWVYDEVPVQQVKEQPNDEENGETTHFSVMDRFGNIVSCTSTVEHPFGSGIIVKDCGFVLNNELTDFDPMPGGMNQVEPGKRPVSGKSPTILFKDGAPVLTLGSPGGATIISSVVQTILNVIDFEMDLKDAIEEPRIFTPMGPHIEWEPGMNMEAKGHMEGIGFSFNDKPHSIGNVQAIQINPDNGEMYGAADSSREGTAIGLDKDDYR